MARKANTVVAAAHPQFPGFTPSPQQAAFLAAVSEPGQSIVLEAVAGAGKTTTLVYAMAVMQGTVAFVVFNTRNAKEAEVKAREKGVFDPTRHTISTCHSAGFKAINAKGVRRGKDFVQEKKVLFIAREFVSRNPALDQIILPAVNLVGLAKQAMLNTTKESQPAWAALARRYNVDDAIPQGRTMREVVTFAQKLLDISNERRDECVDFDDMVYLPAKFAEYPVRQYDNVMIDEAQDTNAARRALAARMLKPGGRLVAVGDRHQALYAFTGADSGALDLIAEQFDATWMPLSVSYRCPKLVVAEARKDVSHIEAHESAPEGVVRSLTVERDKLSTLGLLPTDAIICRINRPLVRTAYDLIKAGTPCRIEGRDIGRSLIALSKKIAGRSDRKLVGEEGLIERINAWVLTETEEAQKKDDKARIDAAEDKAGALNVFIEKAQERVGLDATVADVWQEIDTLFADDVQGRAVLSSIHRAKGREWHRVFWLQASFGGSSKRPLKEWEQETEVCCNYVAKTRAQHELVYLTIPEGR